MTMASFPYVMNELFEMFVKPKANLIDYVTVLPLVGVHHHAVHHGVHLLAHHTLISQRVMSLLKYMLLVALNIILMNGHLIICHILL